MNATSETHPHTIQGFLRESMAANSTAGGVGAIAVIILAILGLAGFFANIVAPVATIIIGLVLLTDGLSLSAALRRSNSQETNAAYAPGMGNGITAGFFGGLAAIVLGILSFFRMAPEPLLAVALLVSGTAVLMSGGAISRLNWLLQFPGDASLPETSAPMIAACSGGMFIGLGTVVLGILAVIGLVPMTLILVGLLSLGASALFNSSPINHAATR